ncbi:hypothetical protein C2E23DRAFT_314410 [Lenzites betulinus]|nr:hypothetical protein C2E23DRAFT_314410 [Lenzites betulinus]
MPVDTLFFLVIYAWNVVAQFVWHFQRALALPVCTKPAPCHSTTRTNRMSLLWLSRTLPMYDQLRVRAYPAQLVSIGDLLMRSHVLSPSIRRG